MEMEPNFRNYQINRKFQEKDGYHCCIYIGYQKSGYHFWKLRKKKVKHEIIFRNYSSRLVRVLSTIRT